jgi:hypothetical protein
MQRLPFDTFLSYATEDESFARRVEDSANLPDPDIIAAEWSEWDERHGR